MTLINLMGGLFIKKYLLLLVCIFSLISLGFVFPAETSTLYYFDDDNLCFDLNGMKNVSPSSAEADIRIGTTGSSSYFIGRNNAAIKDMGTAVYEEITAPASGYSVDRVPVLTGHVYAIRCGDRGTYIIKVTNCNSDGMAEFMARSARAEENLILYYLSGDSIRFDLATMQAVPGSSLGDIYFRYMRTSISGINGASIADLGTIDYNNAKAPRSGYTTEDVKLVNGHVYSIRSGQNRLFMIKVTNIENESNFEFMARTAEPGTESPSSASAGSMGTTSPATGTPVPTPPPTEGRKKTFLTKKTELYWVENDTRFVLGGKILFEDNEGVLEPFLSPDKKSVVYTNGSYTLYLYDIAKKSKRKIYELSGLNNQVNYGVYPIGWSSDSKQIAFMTSYKGGFIGGNQLMILTLSSKKTSVVAKGLSSADWSRDGRFVIANGSNVWLVDKLGRSRVNLKVPTARAFFGADNVSFIPNGTKVVYKVAGKFYLHDLKSGKYEELAIPSEPETEGTARTGKEGLIVVIQDSGIYAYNPITKEYGPVYQDADSSYANWIK